MCRMRSDDVVVQGEQMGAWVAIDTEKGGVICERERVAVFTITDIVQCIGVLAHFCSGVRNSQWLISFTL